MPDIVEVKEGTPAKRKPRFDKRDFQTIADFVKDEANKRRDKRRDLEKDWKEIDRQLRMEPDLGFKMVGGNVRKGSEWMPEMELPLQSQTLEILTADARRLMHPKSGSWYRARSALTDTYLERVDFESLIAGDETEVPSLINQDNADKLVEGYIDHYHRQYDFWGEWDKLHAEAFKYGVFVGRGKIVEKNVFAHTTSGVRKKTTKIPALFANSIKNVLLDDSPHHMMHEGQIVGPAQIRCAYRNLVDLQMQAAKGSADPDKQDGGWIRNATKDLEPNDDGTVELLEYEGDLIVPRKTTRSLYLPNVTVLVAVGKNRGVVTRLSFSKFSFSSYLVQPYHVEHVDSAYGASPLLKGMPIQKAATEALNRLVQWGILQMEPPIKYNKDDPFFAAEGGPVIAPRELWPTMGEMETVAIGDGGALLQAYIAYINQYSDVTGVNAPRLGAETKSHTTAFSKEVETQKGQARTVDYMDTVYSGAGDRWLQMEYELGKASMSGTETFYIPAYGGWVDIKKDHLPDIVEFDVFGAGGPLEEREKDSRRLASLQLAMQVDALKVQNGLGKPMNYDAIQREILTNGGWTDVDIFLTAPPQGVPSINAGVPGVSGVDTALGGTVPPALESAL